MKRFFFLLLLTITGYQVPAQTRLDSLRTVWQDQSQTDTIRLNALLRIAREIYLFSQPDSAFYFAQQSYDFSERIGNKNYMANALNVQGNTFWVRGDYPKALDYFHRCLPLFEEAGDKDGMARVNGNIGSVYNSLANYPKSLVYLNQSLRASEKTGSKKPISTALNNIGAIYFYQGNYPEALMYYKRSLQLSEEMKDQSGIATKLNNIGEVLIEQGDQAGALEYYTRSLQISEKIEDKVNFSFTLNQLGKTYMKQGNYPLALEYYQRCLRITEEIGEKLGVVAVLNSIGQLYNKQRLYQKAIAICENGLAMAQQMRITDEKKNACECLYDAYKGLGNGNQALAYHEQMLVFSDSLNMEETAKKLQQMEFAKQVLADSITRVEEKRLIEEAHQEEVQQENRTKNIAVALGLSFLVLAGGLYSRINYIRKSKAIIEKERDRSDNLLLNILPEEIARELKEKGRADARDFELVSILFSDFKEFTSSSEKLSAKELVSEINICFEAFDAIMEKYGVEKIKTIGDAYMAAGGLPVPGADSTRDTVLAGLAMQAFIENRKAENKSRGQTAFGMRVGIHTGPVVAGIVGVKKFQYDIWGDTVNTASRIESTSEEGKVNISQSTYELLKDDETFVFESRGKIEAKGKGEIDMYFVTAKVSG